MRYLVLDTETTGVISPIHIVEIAWMEVEEDTGVVPGSEFMSLVNPGVPIPLAVSAIHGITEELVKDSPRIEDIKFPDGKIILICHNSPYDRPLVEKYMNIVSSICTLKLSRRVFPKATNHKLATLAAELEFPLGIFHRAQNDVRTVGMLLERLVEQSKKTLPELVEWSNTPYIFDGLPFGMHRGKPINEVPKSYLKWVLGLKDLDDDVRHTLKKYFINS